MRTICLLFVLVASARLIAETNPEPVLSSDTLARLRAVSPMNVFELSDLYFHKRLNVLLSVGDAGDVIKFDVGNFSNFESWPVTIAGSRQNYDLEGIVVADESSDYFYVLDERSGSIVELHLLTKGEVIRKWTLASLVTNPSYSVIAGFEALSFVQNDSLPEGGRFFVGLQRDGTLFELTLPVKSSRTSEAYVLEHTHVVSNHPMCTNSECMSALTFFDGRFWAVWSENSAIITELIDFAVADTVSIPKISPAGVTDDVEGVAFVGANTLYLCTDGTGPRSQLYRVNVSLNSISDATTTTTTTPAKTSPTITGTGDTRTLFNLIF
jgi:hypothetical protein